MNEIEQTRQRLEDGLEELAGRFSNHQVSGPGAAAIAMGGVLGGAVFLVAARRRRGRRRAMQMERGPVNVVAQFIPEEWAHALAQALEDGKWKGPAAVALGAWALLRLAELRQLRKLNRALIARR